MARPSIRLAGTTHTFTLRHMEQQDVEELMNFLDVWCERGDINNYTLARHAHDDVDELVVFTSYQARTSLTIMSNLRRFMEGGGGS